VVLLAFAGVAPGAGVSRASDAACGSLSSRSGTANALDYLLPGNATGGFTTQPVPETTAGYGDRVYPLDYNHDGLTDFLVLNGGGDSANVPGPIQLLTPLR
jgi:hypothetical protein